MNKLCSYLWHLNALNITEKRGVKLSDLSARRGTYDVGHGEKQPCIKVYPDKTNREMCYRFSPLYRAIGPTTVLMTTYFYGAWDDEYELNFEWDDFSSDLKDVKKLVLLFVAAKRPKYPN